MLIWPSPHHCSPHSIQVWNRVPGACTSEGNCSWGSSLLEVSIYQQDTSLLLEVSIYQQDTSLLLEVSIYQQDTSLLLEVSIYQQDTINLTQSSLGPWRRSSGSLTDVVMNFLQFLLCSAVRQLKFIPVYDCICPTTSIFDDQLYGNQTPSQARWI